MNMHFFGGQQVNALDTISHDDLVRAHKAGQVTVVDVRERGECASGIIKGAINVPLSDFDPTAIPQDKTIVLYCASGGRATMAQHEMRAMGFKDVRVYRPGITVWKMQGGPMG